jgi:hypothetical protein
MLLPMLFTVEKIQRRAAKAITIRDSLGYEREKQWQQKLTMDEDWTKSERRALSQALTGHRSAVRLSPSTKDRATTCLRRSAGRGTRPNMMSFAQPVAATG